MKFKALIIEPSRFFQTILIKELSTLGVECLAFSSYARALEEDHDQYTFILVANFLEDISGEIFLDLFSVRHNISDALTIILSSNHDDKLPENTRFKRILNRQQAGQLHDMALQYINHLTLDLEADILLVESSERAAQMMMALFAGYDATVTHVRSLQGLRRAFNGQTFDLIITDYQLQAQESGQDVIAFVRHASEVNKANTPLLVISAESTKELRTSLLRSGANDFLLKPYDNDELLVRASNLIGGRRLLEKSQQQQQDLMKLTLTDRLTGLYNRHSLYDIAEKYISNAVRHKAPLSLVLLELDQFKVMLDGQGHQADESTIQTVARLLQENCRTEDMLARFADDQFAIMLTNCDIDFAEKKAELLRRIIADEKPGGVDLTISAGVTSLFGLEAFQELFERADKALNEARENGRNQVVTG